MISKEDSLQMIQESLTSLHRVGLLEENLVVCDQTVLLGSGSALDSIAFVTLITDLEDRMSRHSNRESYLVLEDVHEFNADKSCLSAETLARYIAQLTDVEQ
jgi:acyl carrier protein